MVQSRKGARNALNELGYKIFLDRYALKDVTRSTLAVGDTVIVVVDSKTGQREIGKVTALNLPKVTVELLDGEVVTRDLEHVDKPLETTPEQMMARVAAGIAQVEQDEASRKEWTKKFQWLLDDWKFVPGGRILSAAGTDQNLTFYNCMPPQQEILTADGYKPIADVRVGDLVVTHRNRLRPVLHKFERDTEELIYIIKPKKLGFDDLRVTGDHKIYVIRSEWVNKHRSRDGLRLAQEPQWIPAKDLKPGDYLAVAYNGEICPVEPIFLSDYLPQYSVEDGRLFKLTVHREHGYIVDNGTLRTLNNRLELDADLCYLFGRWLGDGCVTHRTKSDIPSGIKIVFSLEEKAEAENVARIIQEKFGLEASLKLSSTERWYDLWVNSMPLGEFFKAFLGAYSYHKRIPNELMNLPDDLTLELLRGLFQADGYVSGKYIGILLTNRYLTMQVHQLLLRLGYFFSIQENTHRLNTQPAYRLTSTASDSEFLFQHFFNTDAPERGHDLKVYIEYDGLRWVRINAIEVEDYTGTVMDIEVAEDHSFVSAGVVVSNCYVIPSPSDSREGIINTLGQMTEIMSRGGGVGINISTLRPRHAYVKGVNGRSSGAVSWGALYSFVTGLIEQGGCFGPNERIATDKGLIPSHELADRMDAGEVFFAHTHKGLRQITARFRNGIKPLYRMTTKRGYSVQITEDHKVAVLMDGKITTMALKYLQPGDEVLLLLGDGINSEYVALETETYDRSIMSTRLNEDVRLPNVLNEDLAYLLGYMYGDGYVIWGKKVNWSAPKGMSLAAANAYPEIQDRLTELIAELFDLQPVIEPGDGAFTNIKFYSRIVIEWLLLNGLLKPKAKDVRVPEQIFRSPSSVIGSFIAGYFDADGCNRGRKGGYSIDSISLEMLQDIQQLLALNGIVSHIVTTDRSEQNWQTIYRLAITGTNFKQRFAEFAPAEKVNSSANGKRDMYNTYPSEVWTSLGIRAKYRQRIYAGVSQRISFNQMLKINQHLENDQQHTSSQQMSEILHTLPDTISTIEFVGDSEVFDFEVDDVHLLSGNGIYTSNSRRGALMLILNDWHPDVFDFINSKREAGNITNANISVGISDKFMEAVKADADWDLVFPDTTDPDYNELWDGDLETWIASGRNVQLYKTIKARELWDAIIESAWASAEPGVWFRERSNKMANSWYFNPLISTNPCVTGDTRIYTDKGMIKAIDLFNDETEIEAVIDGRFGLENTTTPATRVFMTGTKPVFRLQTVEGYYLRATADHRIMTPRGWVELRDLKEGDYVHILNRKGGFGQEGSLELGRILGWLVGDGTLKADRAVLSFFGDEKRELAPMFAQYVDDVVAPMTMSTNREYNVGVVEVADRDEARVQSDRLRRLAEEYGLVENKFQVPEVVFRGTEDMQRGFLQALFTADGSVQKSNGAVHVRLSSSHVELLEQVQMLLSNFGIASRLYRNRREAQFRPMPDGKGGLKEYWVQAQHELDISKRNLVTFGSEIGFILSRKNETLKEYLAEYTQGPRQEKFAARIASIIEDGVEDVFDLTEPITHSFISNGLVLHNCGEQPLGAFSVCNLGAINLAKFYDEENDDVDWENLGQTVRYAVRFLDNVIDTTPYFFEENARVQGDERRIGLGTMGIAELMIRLRIRYGSQQSVEFIDKLYRFIAENAYLTSSQIAAEKGTFPMFDAEKFLESGFMQQMPEHIRQTIRENGIRNVTLLTQAPTGCVAPDTLISTASGIRPIVELGDPDGEQWQIVTHEVHTDVGLRKASHFYVNGFVPVKTMTTKHGFNLTATHNHRIRIIDENGDYVWRRMDELSIGDKVVLKKNTLGEGETVELTPVEQGNSSLSKLQAVMTPELAELLGLYMSDGDTKQRGGLHIIVAQRDPDLLEHVQNLMQQVWGEHNISVEEGVGYWTVNLNGHYISRFFEANGLLKPSGNHGEDAAGAFIPSKVLQAGRECVAAFLRGLFEADGNVSRGTITLVSTSKTLIHQVQVALLGLGIVATARQLPKQSKRYDDRPLYEICILNPREAVTFVETVNFISERKRALAADLGNVVDRGDSVAVPALCEELYQVPQGLKNDVRQVISGRMDNGVMTQQFVKGMVAEHEVLSQSRLAQLVLMDVYLDEVVSVEDGTSYTYDLSVPDNKTYIANGFVSHNTTGTMVNTSTGVEPFFSWTYYRKSRLGLHEEQVPVVKEWFDAHPDQTELPDYFVSAMDLKPEEHVLVQSAFQRWIDSAISKTCNVPNEYTIEQTRQLYEYMYDLGCKGGTIYRDGSRDEQVLMLKGDKRAESEVKKSEGDQQDKVERVATPHHVYPRPAKLHGVTVTCPTPFGTAYVTMNSDEHGYPFEVFITAPGKAGSDLQADAEGLGRMISLSLRTTEPHNRLQMLKLIIEQLQDIGGARSLGFGPRRVISLPDSVARVLQENFFPQDQPQQLDLPMMLPQQTASNKTAVQPNGVISGADLCPSCGTISLVRAEGCRKCLTCGYSEC
ncbi:MAG: hypothetical protein CUN56_05480 [Phototrophicales bacterium]|nr:MAG: hypothetical protein CUN56_05480 [Phototrophicales bacterium]